MKVSVVTTWPPHMDGIALYSAELYECIGKLVDVRIIANEPSGAKIHIQQGGIEEPILRCWKRGSLTYPFRIFRAILKTRANTVHFQHGWLLYGDFVVSHFFQILLLVVRVARRPCIVTFHTIIPRRTRVFSNSLIDWLAHADILLSSKSILRIADRVIVHNDLMKRTLREYSPQDEAKITIIPHGIRRCCALESPKRNCQARILSLGFIRERKGIEDLITAFKQVLRLFPGAKLIIVGGQHAHDKGEYRRNIQKLVEPNLDKSVFFTGFVDERLLERLVHKSDIIVLISKDVYVESSGALATVADCGKPIICSRIPKFQGDLKTGYDCIMVSPSNSTELSQAIVSLLKDQRFMEILRKNLAKHSESRNWETVAEQHVKLYAAVSRIE